MVVCFQYNLVLSQQCSNITRRRQCNLAKLRPICTSSAASVIFCGSLELSVSCQQTSFWPLLLSLLLVFWAWLRPGFVQKTSQPLLFSLTTPPPPTSVWKGTGLLISNNWKYSTHSSLCNKKYFEFHAIMVTAPVKLHIVMIYHLPGQLAPL